MTYVGYLMPNPVYTYISKVGDRSRGWPEGSLHQGVGEDTTRFSGLLLFTLDPYLMILSVKQGGIKYHFWVSSMTRAIIEYIWFVNTFFDNIFKRVWAIFHAVK